MTDFEKNLIAIMMDIRNSLDKIAREIQHYNDQQVQYAQMEELSELDDEIPF